MKRTVLTLAILYLAVLIVITLVIHTRLNSYWLVTSLLFSPRWMLALPLALLIPWTLIVRRRFAWFYLAHVFLILFPILGYELPRRTSEVAPATPVVHVLTCNVGGGRLDQERFVRLLKEEQIDVVMLQECSQTVAESLFEELDWRHLQSHQVVLGSPFELSNMRVLARHPKAGFEAVAAIACEMDWPRQEPVQLVSVHLPTFRPALEKLQHFDPEEAPVAIEKRGEMYRAIALRVSDAVIDSSLPTIVAGDFNVPIESDFYREFWSDFQNAFSLSGNGFGYTKYTRLHGIRIDHVLADRRWKVLTARVGPDLGGDHRPVIVQLARTVTL